MCNITREATKNPHQRSITPILSTYESRQNLQTTPTDVLPDKLVQVVTLLTGIQEEPGSTHGLYNFPD